MLSGASVVPAESDVLCEGCGYTLKGLPETGKCPECGRAIWQSLGGHRRLSAFEDGPGVRSFIQTTFGVLFRPGRFYCTLVTREGGMGAMWFARWHWGVAAVLFAVAASGHVCLDRFLKGRARAILRELFGFLGEPVDEPVLFSLLIVPLAVTVYILIVCATRLAARLTAAWAAHDGVRLSLPVVLRGLRFHSVCYVPVAFLMAATVCGYIGLLEERYYLAWGVYVCVLSGEAILCAVYLLIVYRIAMKNMMYANR